ncbi:hypothetical protein N9I36_01235 [Planktomarina temperata]|nr:hypothetical protein [Planktomarina temperata]
MVVLPHEGLGDLIAIIPGLQELSKIVPLAIICDEEKWDQIINTFENVPNVSVRHFVEDKTYQIPADLCYKNETLIALGFYSRFPIIKYPKSFYFQMGIPEEVSRRKLILKPTRYKYDLPEEYIFIDLSTSNEMKFSMPNKNKYEQNLPTVKSVDNNTLLVTMPNKEYSIRLDQRYCFREKIHVALNSSKIICSDAALFNALIRLKHTVPIHVFTRNHVHTHDNIIYRNCRFDGGLYEFN